MNWWIWVASLFCCMSANTLLAEDYRLRIETFEGDHGLQKGSEKARVESIEVLAKPGQRFRSIIVLGQETLILSGKLTAKEKDGFSVQVRYTRRFETGDHVQISPTERQPVIESTSISTTVNAQLKKPVTIGGAISAVENRVEDTDPSERRIVLTLFANESDDE